MRFDLDVYLNYRFPNPMASAIQTVRMAEAFARLGLRTRLWYRGGAIRPSAWHMCYGVGPRFVARGYPGLY